MIRCSLGVVAAAGRVQDGVQPLTVRMADGSMREALHYPDAFRAAAAGDRVWLNTTAVDLGLGTGGQHFVIAFADASDGLAADRGEPAAGRRAGPPGHLMKLRYTPLQRAVLAAEEPDSPHHARFLGRPRLEGMPVLIGELHSMLPIAAAWLRYRSSEPLRIVYVMSDGGALPLAYSRHAAYLRRAGWIDATVTYGHAYGGDLETMNKFTALIAARHVAQADIAIVAMGPGIAGTGTELGHTGVETGEIANAAARLGGTPILMPRLSFADPRERHRGISHHTLSVLRTVVCTPLELVLPDGLEEAQRRRLDEQLAELADYPTRWVAGVRRDEMARALERLGRPVTTMGRSFAEDPAFFLAVGAAAERALEVRAALP
jgi:hypothetical protein